MTAMDLTVAASSGIWPWSFFSSTEPCSAIRCATIGAGEWIHHAAARRVVHYPGREFGAHDSAHHIVEASQRHLPAGYRRFQRVAEIAVARLFVIQAGQRGLGGGVRPSPIGKHEALKPPGLLQYAVEQVAVLTGPIAVQLVVRAHHHAGLPFFDGDLECQQVGFAHRAFAELDVADVPARLLVVEGVVLHVADDVLALQPANRAAPPSFRPARGPRPGIRNCGRCAARA